MRVSPSAHLRPPPAATAEHDPRGARASPHADTMPHHPLAGVLMRSRSSPAAWREVRCDPRALIGRVELHVRRGLLTLIAAPESSPPLRGRQQDIQHAITAAIPIDGAAPVTLHQNHGRHGGKGENPTDLDYYHALGLPMQSGQRANHYHLEFPDRLEPATLLRVLNALAATRIGGRPLLTSEDMQDILRQAGVESPREDTGTTMPPPPENEDAAERTRRRDALHEKYLSLCHMNRQQAIERREDLRAPRTAFVNAHQATRRRAVEASCLPPGKTQDTLSLQEARDPARLEALAREPQGIVQLLDLRASLRCVMKKFGEDGSLAHQVQAAIHNVDFALKNDRTRP